MFDFGNDFAGNFEKFLQAARDGLFLAPVQAKRCETHRELGDWFKNFAAHCKALRPAQEA